MVFKMEAMTEEDKELYYSFGFIEPTSSSYDPNIKPMPLPTIPGGLAGWVIDRERNAFLRSLGGGACEIPNFYALVWNKDVIIFSTHRIFIKEKRGCKWTIERITVPKYLAKNDDEIVNIIKESLITDYSGQSTSIDNIDSEKYIFEFERKPNYRLEGHEYKSKKQILIMG